MVSLDNSVVTSIDIQADGVSFTRVIALQVLTAQAVQGCASSAHRELGCVDLDGLLLSTPQDTRLELRWLLRPPNKSIRQRSVGLGCGASDCGRQRMRLL